MSKIMKIDLILIVMVIGILCSCGNMANSQSSSSTTDSNPASIAETPSSVNSTNKNIMDSEDDGVMNENLSDDGINNSSELMQEVLGHAQAQQRKIDNLRGLSQSCAQTIQTDYVMEKANQSSNPQAVADFLLLRYERNDSKIQLCMAEIAQETAEYLKRYENDYRIDTQVIRKGIAKYEDMTDFCIKRAKELRASFNRHWNEYVSNYGSGDAYIFDQDDAELSQYGVQ